MKIQFNSRSCDHVSMESVGYLLTSFICRDQPNAPEEGYERLPFLVSKRLTCLNLLAGSTEHNPALGFLEWSKWSFLLLTYLLLKEMSQGEERLSASIYIKVNRGAFMFALNNSCAPSKNPQQGQLDELPVMPQSCVMNHCCPLLAERALECISWGNSFPEALIWHPQSLRDLLQPGRCTWQAASMPSHPALLFFRRCKVLMFTT